MKLIFQQIFDLNSGKRLSLRQIFIFSSIYLLLSIGCFWQIISISRLFFDYPTIVSVQTDDREYENELPAFSFCSNLEPSDEETKNYQKTLQQYFTKFNLIKQIFKFEIHFPDYETNNESTIPEDIINNSIQTINAVYVCYTFNSLIKSKGEPIKLKKNIQLSIYLDLTLLTGNSSYLYFHDWYTIPNGWDWNTITIREGDETALSFKKKRFKLLRSPYRTDCIDYEKETPFESKSQCLNDCRIRLSQEKCKVIVQDATVMVTQTGNFARNKKDWECIGKADLHSNCSSECSHSDCVKDYYRADKYYTIPTRFNKTVVKITIPSEPQTIYSYRPKIETIEFLCYCASLISLWFGFSLASIYNPIKRIIDCFDSRELKQKPIYWKVSQLSKELFGR